MCLCIYLGYGLWKLQNTARRIAIGLQVYFMLNRLLALEGAFFAHLLIMAYLMKRRAAFVGLSTAIPAQPANRT